MTPSAALIGAASNGKALWYLTRSTGLVALVLLTATVVLGVVASVGWTTERWPRFLSQDVHRNLSLFCVGFVAIHVITTVSDGYVPIGFADAFVPFRTPYRPLYVGLGALTFDLLLAVLITSALRHRIGFASWRFVHWLAYLCFPIALFHSLGSGTDAPLPLVLTARCGLHGRRRRRGGLATGHRPDLHRRPADRGRRRAPWWSALALAGVRRPRPAPPRVVPPVRHVGGAPGPAGPEERPVAASSAASATTVHQRPRPPGPRRPDRLPRPPSPCRGEPDPVHLRRPTAPARCRSFCPCTSRTAAATPLTVTLVGDAVQGGGVCLSSGTVTLGSSRGVVTSLDGGTVSARALLPDSHGPHPLAAGGPELGGSVRHGHRHVPVPAMTEAPTDDRRSGPVIGPPVLRRPPRPRAPSGCCPGSAPTAGPSRSAHHLTHGARCPTGRDRYSSMSLERSGLRGQGGAWFPVATKWRSLRRTRMKGPVIVANGAEGEPASGKDRLLVHQLPHLVLDGAAVAARTLGASQVFVHVHATAVDTMRPGHRRAAARRGSTRSPSKWSSPLTATWPARSRPSSIPSQDRSPATPYFTRIRHGAGPGRRRSAHAGPERRVAGPRGPASPGSGPSGSGPSGHRTPRGPPCSP